MIPSSRALGIQTPSGLSTRIHQVLWFLVFPLCLAWLSRTIAFFTLSVLMFGCCYALLMIAPKLSAHNDPFVIPSRGIAFAPYIRLKGTLTRSSLGTRRWIWDVVGCSPNHVFFDPDEWLPFSYLVKRLGITRVKLFRPRMMGVAPWCRYPIDLVKNSC